MILTVEIKDGTSKRLSVQLLHLLVISVKIKANFACKTSFKVKGVLAVSQYPYF